MESDEAHQNEEKGLSTKNSSVDNEPEDHKSSENNEAAEQTVRQRRASSTASDASVSIAQRLLQPEYSKIRKVLWCVVVITCTLVCFWQLALRIQHYLEEPTAFIYKVEYENDIHFPAITICPAREPFNDDAWKEAFQLPDFYDSPKSNASLKDIWSEYAITPDDLIVRASCNESNYCDFLNSVKTNMNTKILPTFWGLCVSLSRDEPIEYRGASTYIEIYLQTGAYGRNWFGRTTAGQFFFHDARVAHRHEAFLLADLWSKGRDTIVQLTIKEYRFLNSSRNRCDSQTAAVACQNKCVDDRLDGIVNCSLPFMTSKWDPCRTAAEAKLSFDQTREFYYNFNSSECICRRICRQKLYHANTNTAEKRNDNKTSLMIQFSDNLVEKIIEEYDYSFSALVSDVGGTLGIFLGVSILSLLKMFENTLDGFKNDPKQS